MRKSLGGQGANLGAEGACRSVVSVGVESVHEQELSKMEISLFFAFYFLELVFEYSETANC